ncbi:MAG: hypothetical protein WC876_07595 [Candidatus Thermoplasmatota archaeon]|jgi:hypothetical protein
MMAAQGKKWLKVVLWTLGIALLLVGLYFHLMQGGGPARHV